MLLLILRSGCNCFMIQNNTYPNAVYDKDHIVCYVKSNPNCTSNCDYMGDGSGAFANSYSISN